MSDDKGARPCLFRRAYIGLGANLGEPHAQVLRAFDLIEDIPGVTPVARSSLYRSAPLGPGPQPDYCNAACAIDTASTPEALLQRLQAIEHALGRERPRVRWAPRCIDLDLLHVEGAARVGGALTLPHPELHKRNFVLAPLAEIAPTLEVPGLGRIDALARALGEVGLARWELV
ncbi:MAG TPA: 2-amino-4-hydroxy-6-hydroxymethyldihydropteridine diphosphokinase [Verrucomicrobiae bacterium]|nr:2-amino-4-hydroxy-6-hydroxymethyldihydropteridine diphosphokinase [Verrucomicrobiae bacterium]